MSGGIGNDTFIENAGEGADTISDFNSGNTGPIDDSIQENNDFIDLSAFYNQSVVDAISGEGGPDFKHGLNLMKLDQADGHLDGEINNQIYSEIGDINLTLLSDGIAIDEDDLTFDNTNVVCFAQGTLIRTQKGEVRIEDLSPGDLVWTQDSGFQPIAWIGSQKLTFEELKQNPNLRPIRIKKGALGLDLPCRDLVVSPQHRILLNSKISHRIAKSSEILIAAKFLIQLPDILIDEEIEEVEYFHMMFETHQLVVAEGALAESLYFGSEAIKGLQPAARLELQLLFPMLCTSEFVPRPVRPFVSGKKGRSITGRHMKNKQPLLRKYRA